MTVENFLSVELRTNKHCPWITIILVCTPFIIWSQSLGTSYHNQNPTFNLDHIPILQFVLWETCFYIEILLSPGMVWYLWIPQMNFRRKAWLMSHNDWLGASLTKRGHWKLNYWSSKESSYIVHQGDNSCMSINDINYSAQQFFCHIAPSKWFNFI